MVVVLPPEDVVAIDLVAEARAGEVELFSDGAGMGDGGTNIRRAFTDRGVDRSGSGHLEVDIDVGLGSIQVVRSEG